MYFQVNHYLNVIHFCPQRGEMSVVDLAPGYVLSRSKERISVTIKTDDFFNENEQVYTSSSF